MRQKYHFFVRLQVYFHLFNNFNHSFYSFPMFSLFVLFQPFMLMERSVFMVFGIIQLFSALLSIIRLSVSNIFLNDVWLFLSYFVYSNAAKQSSVLVLLGVFSIGVYKIWINDFGRIHWQSAGVWKWQKKFLFVSNRLVGFCSNLDWWFLSVDVSTFRYVTRIQMLSKGAVKNIRNELHDIFYAKQMSEEKCSFV